MPNAHEEERYESAHDNEEKPGKYQNSIDDLGRLITLEYYIRLFLYFIN